VSSNHKPAIQIAWKTVTYRSVVLAVAAVLVAFSLAVRFAFPQFSDNQLKSVDRFATALVERLAGAAAQSKAGAMSSQQAHMTALDGTVRVRKSNSNTWVKADYNVPLEKGDVVQTGPEGMAKIVFNDGTNYTVKQDSLITIEENSANEKQQTNVAVAVSTGTVDLATATYVQGSKSQVIVGGATASLSSESSARVSNDPKSDKHEILLKKGEGEIERKGEIVHLANWERVSFQSDSSQMEKIKEIGPPHSHFSRQHDAHFLLQPGQGGRIFLDPDGGCGGLSFATLAQSLLFLNPGRPQGNFSGRNGFRTHRRSLLLDAAVLRRLGQVLGRE
jgi:hypothetical protein